MEGRALGDSFGWEAFRIGEYSTYPGHSGSGYTNVRFRVCNMNWNTAYVGTCGSS